MSDRDNRKVKISLSSKKKRKVPLPAFNSDNEIEFDVNLNDDITTTKTIQIYPSDKQSCRMLSNNLMDEGCIFAETGDYLKALDLFIRGNYIDPSNHKVLEAMAQIYLELGDNFKALKYSHEAVSICPDWSEGYLTLARAQREYGEIELSLASYNKSISLSHSNNIEVINEITELEEILTTLETNREKLKGYNVTKEEDYEVKTCLYNLSSRPGYYSNLKRYY